jgi:tetratricopeptide (TPR) repeat protein
LKENPRDNRALVFRAQLALAKKDPASAIVDLRSVIKDQPGSMEVVALLANAHRLNKEPELGRDVITSAIKLYPNGTDLRLLNADYLYATGSKEAAIREVDDVIRHYPKLARAYEVKAALHGASKDVSGAERTFAALKAALPEDAIGPYRLGLVYAAQRKHDQAIPEFELALNRAPNSREPIAALVSSYAAIGKLELAAARATELARSQPGNFVPPLILGDVYTAMKRFADAEAALSRAAEIQPKAAGVYLGLSRMRTAQNDLTRAAAELERGLKVIPDDFGLTLALAEVHQRKGDNARALADYEGLLRRYPSNDIVANNLAYLLGEARADKVSLDRALQLAKRFETSTNPSFLDTLGWLHLKRGSLEEALPLLRKAYDQVPQAPNYQYHLGVALLNGGQAREGAELIRSALDSQPNAEWATDAKKRLGAR